jgi:hypothetical protein
MRKGMVLFVLAAVACASSAVIAQQPAAKTGGVAVVQTYKGKAVVLYVDDLARNITVTINGQLHNYTLADSVRGIMQIKAGDTLNIETVEALGVYLKRASEPPIGTAASMMTVQVQGKAAIQGVQVKELQGKIVAINPSVRELSIQVNKDTLSFVADTSLHNFSRLKVGESVVMRYTTGMVVAVAK